jgi:hypothetical protein
VADELAVPHDTGGATAAHGDRDVVVELLEHYSRVTIADRDRWLADIALIREGKMPIWARS